ncbi:MAG: Hsp20 family protein [Candidatus Bathyarchaeia archaeon]
MAIRERKRSFFDAVDRYFEDLEREFESWRDRLLERPSWDLKRCTMEPLKDVRVTPTEVVVTADLPLTAKSTVQVKPLDDRTIEISAKMKKKLTFKELGITHHQGEFKQFQCQTSVPVPVQMSKMKVHFKKGLLEVHIPRKRKK